MEDGGDYSHSIDALWCCKSTILVVRRVAHPKTKNSVQNMQKKSLFLGLCWISQSDGALPAAYNNLRGIFSHKMSNQWSAKSDKSLAIDILNVCFRALVQQIDAQQEGRHSSSIQLPKKKDADQLSECAALRHLRKRIPTI